MKTFLSIPRRAATARAMAIALAAATVAGCSANPEANVSDVHVYTSLHLRAMELANDPNNPPTLATHMHRYFANTPAEYDAEKLRMDQMLDSQQRLSGFAQAVQTVLALDVTATLKNVVKPAKDESKGAGGGSSDSGGGTGKDGSAPKNHDGASKNDDPPKKDEGAAKNGGAAKDDSGAKQDATAKDDAAAATAALSDALRKLVTDQINGTVSDSPFDQLDRAADFYAAYNLKLFRLRGDSRTVDSKTLVNFLRGFPDSQGKPTTKPADPSFPTADVPASAAANASRQIVLYLQSHVDRGTRPNMMVGLRLKVISAETRGNDPAEPAEDWHATAQDHGAGLVKVVRLHPTRNYDVDSDVFAESIKQAIALSGKVDVPAKFFDASVSGKNNSSVDAQSARRFLARVGKTASFADAARHEFGWNFYPSNVEVVTANAWDMFVGFLAGAPRVYSVRSYLESGGHDCMAVLIVPRNLKRFSCEITNVYASVDPNALIPDDRHSPRRPRAQTVETMTVELPAYDPNELAAGSYGVVTQAASIPLAPRGP